MLRHMRSATPFRFTFIRALCPHLSEEEAVDADIRFAAYLQAVAAVAKQVGDNRFDETPRAP